MESQGIVAVLRKVQLLWMAHRWDGIARKALKEGSTYAAQIALTERDKLLELSRGG